MSTVSTTRTTTLVPFDNQPVMDFDSLRLRVASPEEIKDWSYGEVLTPETINYRTQKPEKDGLFCERIFGPVKDWECACSKYKRIRYRGVTCDKCGVEVTRSLVRRERMGHIELAVPISHIWFVRGLPSKVGAALQLSLTEVEKIIYFASFIILEVDQVLKDELLVEIKKEYRSKSKLLTKELNQSLNLIKATAKASNVSQADLNKELEKANLAMEEKKDLLEAAMMTAKKEVESLEVKAILTEVDYQNLSLKYGHIFTAGIGAEAIKTLMDQIDLAKEISLAEESLKTIAEGKRKKLLQRLRLLNSLHKHKMDPSWMIITVLPVLPPDLRPMVQLDGGRFATSDLNDLYRRVINRNNRLKRLQKLNAPEVIVRNEKRMLQEAVDALIDNGARQGKTVMAATGQKRTLKSIADILKGKQGRFRGNLLGKRIDYSGRSVIVVGPELSLGECGLPKKMALELFKPFVISELIKLEEAHNVRSANRVIEAGESLVWEVLEKVTSSSHVLLNRAPTLHRLGIQAFRPKLIEGKAIKLHPLVCSAFNADFDGDQMAVHVPLTREAKWEAENLMLASNNLLKPATGRPIANLSQDMVLGIYYLTTMEETDQEEKTLMTFSDYNEAVLAYESDRIRLTQAIRFLIDDQLVVTTVGRLIFNHNLPFDSDYINRQLNKKEISKVISKVIDQKGHAETAKFLDVLKSLSFKYVTKSGFSWGMGDLPILDGKPELLDESQGLVDEVENDYQMGMLTAAEKHMKVVAIWAEAKEKLSKMGQESLSGKMFNPVFSMIHSGSRGSWGQTTQMMGMKGLVVSPSGETIELPITSSFQEGFDVLEYFISTHGARKGLSDIALRTANAGYLTRRLVDVSQDIFVTGEDCKTKEGVVLQRSKEVVFVSLEERILGRFLAEDLKDEAGQVILKKGACLDDANLELMKEAQVSEVKIRSVLTCQAPLGVCSYCYGWDLSTKKLVKQGAAVGVVAAQSIGEPGTQLTMRTFHTGGVAGQDITQGLPRVEEIFEARPIKKGAAIAEFAGQITVDEAGLEKVIKLTSQDGQTIQEYPVSKNLRVLVSSGDLVGQGDVLSEGSIDLHDLFRLKGQLVVQQQIIEEIQHIYSSQGQDLNDKHIEIIVKQLFSRAFVSDAGDTNLISGSVIEKQAVDLANQNLATGQKKAKFSVLLLGMTKASLATSSFLSAASFQDTARVLINAAVSGQVDHLLGLKENVIIGRLIPSGTGFEPDVFKKMIRKSDSKEPKVAEVIT